MALPRRGTTTPLRWGRPPARGCRSTTPARSWPGATVPSLWGIKLAGGSLDGGDVIEADQAEGATRRPHRRIPPN